MALALGRSRYSEQSRREGTVAAAVGVGALAVLALWVLDAAPLGSFPAALLGASRVTGLEGTYGALVTVLLLARVAWLERWIGMDRLARWHATVGQATIWLLVAHAALVVWAYAASLHESIPHATRTIVLDLPDMLAATVGLAIFVAISALSVRFVRRLYSYQTWYFLHLYLYLAIALSFAHQFATGGDFATRLPNRVLWASLYVVVFALLLWYRVLVPVRGYFRHRLRVEEVVPSAAGSVSVVVGGERIGELRAQAGQFFIWRFLTPRTWWEAHPFSLSAPPAGDRLRLTVRGTGDFTHGLAHGPAELGPGTKVLAEGPYGSFTSRRRRHPNALLVAGGSGVAPLRALFETTPIDGGDLIMLYQARDAASMALRDELEEVARQRGARIHFLTGHRDACTTLCNPDELRALIGADLAFYDVFLCGPNGFMAAVRRALIAAGAPPSQIHIEHFDL